MLLHKSKQPIIVGVTGHVEDMFKLEGLTAGMDEVQSKPFYIQSLKIVLYTYKYFNTLEE